MTLTVPYSVVVLIDPDADAPILIAVVDPETPAVPRLSVLVPALSVAPAPRPIVIVLVDGAIDVAPVCDAPPMFNKPEVWLVPIAIVSVVVDSVTAPEAPIVVTLIPDCHDGAAPEPPEVSNWLDVPYDDPPTPT